MDIILHKQLNYINEEVNLLDFIKTLNSHNPGLEKFSEEIEILNSSILQLLKKAIIISRNNSKINLKESTKFDYVQNSNNYNTNKNIETNFNKSNDTNQIYNSKKVSNKYVNRSKDADIENKFNSNSILNCHQLTNKNIHNIDEKQTNLKKFNFEPNNYFGNADNISNNLLEMSKNSIGKDNNEYIIRMKIKNLKETKEKYKLNK